MENLHKVGGSLGRLTRVKAFLWQGSLEQAREAFSDWPSSQSVGNFLDYLQPHESRLPNYQSYQQQGLCIGSGSVESTIKRISRRIKLSGAQWKASNVNAVLRQRCAYLNLEFS